MHARSVAAIALVVALVAGGLGALPRIGADPLPRTAALTSMPDTVDGVPLHEAQPRSVVVVDRLALAAGGTPTTNDLAPRAASTTTTTTGSDTDGLHARTMSQRVEVDLEALSEGDRELFGALGLLDERERGVHRDAGHGGSESTEVEASSGGGVAVESVDEPDSAPARVGLDDATVTALLTTRIAEQLDLAVEVEPVIGDRFSVAGSEPEPLTDIPGIAAAEEAVLGMLFAEDVPERFDQQWGLHNHGQVIEHLGWGIPGVDIDWDLTEHRRGGEDVIVAVVDSPFDTSHPALAGRWWRGTTPEDVDSHPDPCPDQEVDECWGWDFVQGAPVLVETPETGDTPTEPTTTSNHGIHVAGTIAADGQTVGVAPRATIMPLVVSTGDATRFYMDRVAQAIVYAVENGAHVINLSLGSAPRDDHDGLEALRDAVEYADEKGVVIIAAAGNQGIDLDRQYVFPASYASPAVPGGRLENVLAVGALDNRGQRWETSNYGRATVGLAAPGVEIIGPFSGGRYGWWAGGTSFAAAYVSGIAALLLAGDDQPARDPDLPARLDDLGVPTIAWAGQSISGLRASITGGPDEPFEVRFSGLSPHIDGDDTDAAVRTTITIEPVEQAGAVTVTLATQVAGQMWAVTDHPLTVNDTSEPAQPDPAETPGQDTQGTAELTTDDEGAIGVLLDDAGSVTLGLRLPQGRYAWIVEIRDLETGNLPAYAAAFEITDPTAPDDDTGTNDPTSPDGPADPSDPATPSTATTPTLETPPTPESPTEENGGTGDADPPAPPEGGEGDGEDDGDAGDSEDPDDNGGNGNGGNGNGDDGQPPDDDPPSPPSAPTPPGEDSEDSEGGDNEPPSDDDGSTGGGDHPQNSRISPNQGVFNELVDIRGNWPPGAEVSFDGQGAYMSFRSKPLLSVRAPAVGRTGPVDVVVWTANWGEIIERFPGGFTYLPTEGGNGSTDPDNGSTDPDNGSTNPDNGSTNPDNDGGEQQPEEEREQVEESEGVVEDSDSGTHFGSLPRFDDNAPTREFNGLHVRRLGAGHPGDLLPDSMWPPMHDGECVGIPIRS